MRQDSKNGDEPAPEEEKEEKKGIHPQERVGRDVGTEAPRTLSLEDREETGTAATAGGAPGAEAPDGASRGAARPFIVPFQPPANARNTDATSPEKVPPGGAAGGGPDPTRAALEIAFGSVFLAQLVGEAEQRQRWLTLDAGRVAELHQSAIESSGSRPWRTLLISQLDLEVAQGSAGRGKGKDHKNLTREEWLAR